MLHLHHCNVVIIFFLNKGKQHATSNKYYHQPNFSCQFQSTEISCKIILDQNRFNVDILVAFERFEHVAAKILS